MGLGSSFLPVLPPSSFHHPEPGSLPERSVARLGDQGGTAWLGSGSTSALTLSPLSLCGHSESRVPCCSPAHLGVLWPHPLAPPHFLHPIQERVPRFCPADSCRLSAPAQRMLGTTFASPRTTWAAPWAKLGWWCKVGACRGPGCTWRAGAGQGAPGEPGLRPQRAPPFPAGLQPRWGTSPRPPHPSPAVGLEGIEGQSSSPVLCTSLASDDSRSPSASPAPRGTLVRSSLVHFWLSRSSGHLCPFYTNMKLNVSFPEFDQSLTSERQEVPLAPNAPGARECSVWA